MSRPAEFDTEEKLGEAFVNLGKLTKKRGAREKIFESAVGINGLLEEEPDTLIIYLKTFKKIPSS